MSKNIGKILKDASIGGILGILFVTIIVIFIMQNTYGLRTGVKIEVSGIEEGVTYTDSVLKLTGVARNANNLSISGSSVPVDMKGNFSSHIVLLPGINTVSFMAEDKFGDKTELRYVVYKEDTSQES